MSEDTPGWIARSILEDRLGTDVVEMLEAFIKHLIELHEMDGVDHRLIEGDDMQEVLGY